MIDILFDNSDNLTGTDESTRTHQQDILVFHKGWNKSHPEIGVGINQYISDESTQEKIKTAISNEFRRDGMTVNEIVLDQSEKIIIDANY